MYVSCRSWKSHKSKGTRRAESAGLCCPLATPENTVPWNVLTRVAIPVCGTEVGGYKTLSPPPWTFLQTFPLSLVNIKLSKLISNTDRLILNLTLIDHPRSGVVYNCGRVCLSVCLSSVCRPCLSDDNFRKPSWLWKFIYVYQVYLYGIRVMFIYEGHRVKVKVTETKKVENPYSRKSAM